MSDELKCPICGEVTSSYMGHYRKDRLCKKHATDLKNGKLLKCEKCYEWHYINELCKCNSTIYKELPTEGFSECVSCGAETSGYAFCRKCFKKYTEEEMLDILNKKSIVHSKAIDHNCEAITESQPPIDKNSETTNNVVVIDFNNKAKCIICGKKTDGLLFCSNCYYKYKNKELLFELQIVRMLNYLTRIMRDDILARTVIL